MTPLDTAHAAMEAAPESAAARMQYYAKLAETELLLLLEAEASADAAEPRLFDLDCGPTVLAFDTDERFADCAGNAAYLALPGRRLIAMLAGQGLTLGINVGAASSAFLMPPEAIGWLAQATRAAPEVSESAISEISPPGDLPEALVSAIDAKLARAEGLAHHACLARVLYSDGARGHVLAIVGADPAAESALATELSEALVFSGVEAGQIDLVFLAADAPAVPRFARVGLRFDLPRSPALPVREAPGTDPDKPPRLK